jgi:hypothetical protein
MISNNLSDLAYCAGVFDGEGCVTLTRDKELTYRLRLKITSTEYSVLAWIQEHFGGTIILSRKETDNNKESWDWYCKTEDQIVFLFGILPYTIIKRAQIIEALNYHFEKQNGGKLTEDEFALRERYYMKLKSMK